MTRLAYLTAVAVASWLVLSSGTAAAQCTPPTCWTDTVGRPIRRLNISLSATNTYEFQTTNLSGTAPDTVLMLRNTAASGTGGFVVGSDGCQDPATGWTWLRSCTAPITGRSGSHYLYMYAAHGVTNGTAEISYRINQTGPWFSLGSYTFGGDRMAWNQPTSIGRVRFETAHRPGNVSTHAILVATPSNYWVQYVGWFNSTRVTGAASFDIDALANGFAPGDWWIYFGNVISSEVGDLRLLRNRWFESGLDDDQDGLDQTLEANLGICDRASQILPSGATCASRVGVRSNPICVSSPSSEVCRQQLRDSDHDGLRDDLEVYGYGSYGLLLPRYGADPRRVDMFLELDTYDQFPGTTSGGAGGIDGCQTFTAAMLNAAFTSFGDDNDTLVGAAPIIAMLAPYAAGPTWMNLDGSPGISLHVDVGLPNPTNVRETRWGAWGGGGTCIALPTTPGATPCPHTILFGGGPYSDPRCTSAPSTVIANQRKIAFRWGIDEPYFSDFSEVTYGQGPGSSPLDSTYYYGADTGVHVHELGHTGHISHSGPYDSSAENVGSSGEGLFDPSLTNYRATYMSRMNYGVGYPGGGDASNWGTYTALSFSSDTIPGLLRYSAMVENCPWPGVSGNSVGVNGLLMNLYPVSGGSGCANVDWNRDGTVAPALATRRVDLAPYFGRRRILTPRRPDTTSTVTTATTAVVLGESGADIINNVLLATYSECTGSTATTCTARVIAESSGDCITDATGPPGVYPSDVYPGCFVHAAVPSLDTVSIAGQSPISTTILAYSNTGGSPFRAIQFAVTGNGALYRRIFDVGTAAPPSEVSITNIGAWTLVLAAGSVATARERRHPAVTATSGPSSLYVVYADPAGALRQLTFDTTTMAASAVRASVPSGSTWSSPAEAPGLAWAGGRLYLARHDTVLDQIGVYQLTATAAAEEDETWDLVGTLLVPGLPLSDYAASLSVIPDPDQTSSTRLRVLGHFAGVTGGGAAYPDVRVYWDSEIVGTANWWMTWGAGKAFMYDGAAEGGPGAGTFVIDARTSIPAAVGGLRFYRVWREIDHGSDSSTSALHLAPFADGRNPTALEADYNDWDAFQFGLCERLEWPRTTYGGGFPSLSYSVSPWSTVDCGPLPIYPGI